MQHRQLSGPRRAGQAVHTLLPQPDNFILHGEEMDAGIEQNNVELTMEGCCTRPPSTAAAALTSCPRRTAVPRHLSHALRPYDRHSLTAEAAGLQRRCGNGYYAVIRADEPGDSPARAVVSSLTGT